MEVTLTSLVEIEPAAVFQKVGDEIVFLHTEEGVYYGLNAIGSRIWELLLQHRDLKIVRDALLDEFEVFPEALTADLLRIIGELHEKKLVRILPAPPVSAG